MKNWSESPASTTPSPPSRLEPGHAERWRVMRCIETGPMIARITMLATSDCGPMNALWVATRPAPTVEQSLQQVERYNQQQSLLVQPAQQAHRFVH